MDAPALLLIPATPLQFDTPPVAVPRKDPGRTSSDAIFSIYSMYGDDHTTHQRASSSWKPLPVVHDRSGSTSSSGSRRQRASVASSSHHRPVSVASTSQCSDSELAYFSADPSPPPLLATDKAQVIMNPSPRTSVVTASSLRAPSTTRSRVAPSSTSRRTPSDLFDSAPSSAGALRASVISSSSYVPPPSLSADKRRSGSPHSSSRRSSRSSPHRRLSATSHELPPLPPSLRSSRTPSPSPTPPPPIAQQSPPQVQFHTQSHPRSQTPDRNSSPSHALLTPKTSMKVNAKHPPSTFGSPSSKISLVPSEGEDLDGFHVRNTYAQLEASGVKGDGYEEGVERTRARIGNSRTSQLQAEEALGDGQEKKRSLDPKEIQLLQNVDRYGFFTIPSHDRLVLLPSAPLLKKLGPVPAGPSSASPNATTLTSLPPVTTSPKEAKRIAKWDRMLIPQKNGAGENVERWNVRPGKEPKLRSRTYKGVPDRWRRAAWDLMLSRLPGVTPQTFVQLGREYRENMERPSSFDVQIDLDVPRTISGHIMFRTRYGVGQRSLFHVLHAFSLRCTSCGYVQGMGPIAATLLCYFEPERVYAALVLLHDSHSLHSIFDTGFPGMLEAIYVQERIMQKTMPRVYEACRDHGVSTTAYATKWYITLFANSVPFQTQLRIWDVFLMEGYDLFVAVAVAVVWAYRDHITSASANFETVLSLLSSFFVPEDEDALMSWVEGLLGDRKMRASMVQWREEWRALVKEGKEGDALL